MPTTLPLQAVSLASNCWPADPQTLINEFTDKGAAVSSDLQGVIIRSTKPAEIDQDKMWIKVDGSTQPEGQFVFGGGSWIWPHEVPAAGPERRLYVGTAASIDTYDGGSAGAVTDRTGPFWEIDTDFQARMPLGVGTLPVSGTVVSVTDTGGVDEHTLAEENIPEHDHGMPLGSGEMRTAVAPGSGNNNDDAVSGGGLVSYDTFTAFGQAAPTPLNNTPPYVGCYFLKRTARVYRTP